MKDKLDPTMTQERPSEKLRNTSMVRACFNLTKSAVGIGTLSLPSTIKKLGWALGLPMIVIASLLCTVSHHFLARLAANTDIADFYGLGKLAYGSVGEMTAVAATLLYLFGALLAYCRYAGDYIASAVGYLFSLDANNWLVYPPYMTILVSAVFIFPLACLKDLSKLANASILGMMCIGYITVLTIVDYFVHTPEPAPTIVPAKFSFEIFECFSVFLFAFLNHFTTVALVPVLIRPTPARRHQLIVTSQIATTTIYLLVAAFGYLHFGDGVTRDILAARKVNLPYALGKLAIGITIIVSYPLLLDPVRSATDHLITRGVKTPSAVRHYALTVGFVASSAVIAATFAKKIDGILDVFSSLAGSLLVFVFPALYFLRMSYKYPVSGLERGLAYFIVVFGAILCVFGTTQNVRVLFKS